MEKGGRKAEIDVESRRQNTLKWSLVKSTKHHYRPNFGLTSLHVPSDWLEDPIFPSLQAVGFIWSEPAVQSVTVGWFGLKCAPSDFKVLQNQKQRSELSEPAGLTVLLVGVRLPPGPASGRPWAAGPRWRSSSDVPAGSPRGSVHLWGRD